MSVGWGFWNPEIEPGATTWTTRARSAIWLTRASPSLQEQHSYKLPPLCNPSPFENLMSYFSVLIAGESSILVDASGESIWVYSLLQRRWWRVALWKRSSTVSLSTLSDNNATALSLVLFNFHCSFPNARSDSEPRSDCLGNHLNVLLQNKSGTQ